MSVSFLKRWKEESKRMCVCVCVCVHTYAQIFFFTLSDATMKIVRIGLHLRVIELPSYLGGIRE